ncbi:hypothetical protein [uncultured Draconibacterium sp.]|uniref:hypothetical protein n=1 Tax=uncultured Draconibacterium sp. TaxID=1573823 RepID=UPI003217886A
MDNLKIANKDYPFDITARGMLNVEGAKIELSKVAATEFEALRFAYQVCKGACSFVETEFKYDFNAFVDKVEVGVFVKARALAETLVPKAAINKAEAEKTEKKN